MSTVYRSTTYSLNNLIDNITSGRIALPDIQRPFVWPASKARDLFDSMYRGYPVGLIMLWETGAEVGTRQIGFDDADRAPQLLIVDGQQRLTSMFAVLTGNRVLNKSYEQQSIRIAFHPMTETFEVTDAAVERDAEFIPDITALWDEGFLATARKFLRRLEEARAEPMSEEEGDLMTERINRVHDLRDFPFQVIELGAESDEEQVADIFVRINSKGVQLNQADFILTLMSVHWEKGRRQLEAFSRAAVDPTITGTTPKNPFIEPSADQMLRVGVALAFRRARLQHVYSILRGKDLDTGEVSEARRTQQFERLAIAQDKALDLTNWSEFLKCLQVAGFRSSKMIASNNALLYSYALWLIGRVDFNIDLPTLRKAIARWFFMAHTTGRYSSSPETQLESDLGRVSDLAEGDSEGFVALLDRIISSNFTNDYWDINLPNRLDVSSSRSPGLFAYLAALSLLDAEALFSDIKVRDLLDPAITPPRLVERHHLFPKAYLKSRGIESRKQVNAIANMAFLDWAENASISAKAPEDYWLAMSETVPRERMKRQTELHALPVGWEQLDYATFLERRRPLIAEVTRRGFETLYDDKTPIAATSIEEVVASGESQTVEFKSTARFNLHTSAADPKMEHVIVKTVCGLLNSEGGQLLIGVTDGGEALGLEADFGTLGTKGNPDGLELFLRQLLDNELTITTAGTVRITFPEFQGQTICSVSVAPAGKPAFARPAKGNTSDAREFWVRIGNATKQLHGDEMVEYQTDHWG